MALLFGALNGTAQVPAWVRSTNAVEFFTNLSSRLLSASGYPFDANNIPVYTNNMFVFTPDVHRILQVAANIYDAETNHYGTPGDVDLPTVLRPTFRRQVDGAYTNIYIGGYVEVGVVTGLDDAQFSIPLDLNDDVDRAVAGASPDQNIYDVPWIFGVKKGFPNFNEFAMQSVSQISRRLQLRRATPAARPNATNQMFIVGISNVFAFEGWNSYHSNYARGVQVFAANDVKVGFAYTNDTALDQRGSNISMHITVSAVTNLDTNGWQGYGDRISAPARASFVVPLVTNFTILPDSIFRAEAPPYFTTDTNNGVNLFRGFEQTKKFPIPQLCLSVSNRIRFIMLDVPSGRVIDCVQISGLDGVRNLSSELTSSTATFVDGTTGQTLSESIFWQTNRPGGHFLFDMPTGAANQILAALGYINVPNWNSFGVGQASGNTKLQQIDSFRVFCGLSPLTYVGTVNTDVVVTAPFTPTRKTSQYLTWQANDPLVHFTRRDLKGLNLSYLDDGNGVFREQPNGPTRPLQNIGLLNDHFEPWGGRPDAAVYNPSPSVVPSFASPYKDSAVSVPDNWDFTQRGSLYTWWLGKVHRGTPWQTLYLKSADVSLFTWAKWVGNTNMEQAALSRPVNDRLLVSSLAALVNTNPPSSLLSVNSTDTNAWRQALGGLLVITNSSTDDELLSTPPTARFETNVVSAFSGQAVVIANAILQTRGAEAWTGVGDVLKTWELGEASPWLNTNSWVQLDYGISDEAYEAIAGQLLPRLRQDSVGTMVSFSGEPTIEFSGYDGFPYAVEVSADLVNWTTVSTNYPANGKWRFTDAVGGNSERKFYRSRVLP